MHGRGRAEQGFTYIGLLMAVVILGLFLTLVSRVWTTTEQREREAQLLWVGHQYRLAIASYYASGRGFPAVLEDLVQDERTPIPRHHLRRLYPDPMTGRMDWTLVLTPDGQGIMGIASSSNAAPIKVKGFDLSDATFEDADCYCNWKFVYWPRRGRWGGAAGHLSPVPPGGPQVAPGVPGPGASN